MFCWSYTYGMPAMCALPVHNNIILLLRLVTIKLVINAFFLLMALLVPETDPLLNFRRTLWGEKYKTFQNWLQNWLNTMCTNAPFACPPGSATDSSPVIFVSRLNPINSILLLCVLKKKPVSKTNTKRYFYSFILIYIETFQTNILTVIISFCTTSIE